MIPGIYHVVPRTCVPGTYVHDLESFGISEGKSVEKRKNDLNIHKSLLCNF